MEASVARLVYCGPEPIRFSLSSRRSFISGASPRKRSRRILAVATDPKPTQTIPPKSTTVNGSSSSPSKGVNNNVSTRINDVSKEIKRVRAQMEEDEQLSVLMRGLRGQNLKDSVFADDNIQLRLVEKEVYTHSGVGCVVLGDNQETIVLGAMNQIRRISPPHSQVEALLIAVRKMTELSLCPSFGTDCQVWMLKCARGLPGFRDGDGQGIFPFVFYLFYLTFFQRVG